MATSPKSSATAKTFASLGVDVLDQKGKETKEDTDPKDCYLFAQKSVLVNMLRNLLCPDCKQPGLDFELCTKNRCGFSVKLRVFCNNCQLFNNEQYLCVGGSTAANVPFDINTRSVLAFRGIGCGHSAMSDWAGVMNMPYTLSRDSYTKTHERIEVSSSITFDEISNQSRAAIEKAYAELGIHPDGDGILNVAVSYDGSWQKRGYSSHNGMGFVIELVTGLPFDYEVLSNFCFKFKAVERKDLDPEWLKNHKENCSKNFDGTASAM